jgi:ubiquinone/menaquinone biosynthesis C-methylase UbiE
MHHFFSQFGHPRGFLGRVAGTIMAIENRERNAWAVTFLDLQHGDHVLEIGFGPGLAIRAMAELAQADLIAGVDESEVMLRQARKRNAAGIRTGRVALRRGSVVALPYPDAAFDKILTVNSLHHWPAPAQNLCEVWRVLKPNGWLAVIEQPHRSVSDTQLHVRGADLAQQLTTAGFQQVMLELHPIKPVTSIGVLGRKIEASRIPENSYAML